MHIQNQYLLICMFDFEPYRGLTLCFILEEKIFRQEDDIQINICPCFPILFSVQNIFFSIFKIRPLMNPVI